jgi:hypothetical protein
MAKDRKNTSDRIKNSIGKRLEKANNPDSVTPIHIPDSITPVPSEKKKREYKKVRVNEKTGNHTRETLVLNKDLREKIVEMIKVEFFTIKEFVNTAIKEAVTLYDADKTSFKEHKFVDSGVVNDDRITMYMEEGLYDRIKEIALYEHQSKSL